MSVKKEIGIAMVQLRVGRNKPDNINNAIKLIREAVTKYNPRIVTLPEFFNSPYIIDLMRSNAENIPNGKTSMALSKLAKELQIYLIGGSIPELRDSKFYNTTTVWSPKGELVATHRKVHIAEDVTFPPSTTVTESPVLSPGNSLNTFTVDGIKMGLGIGYDIFFSEFSTIYRNAECDMIFFQMAFPSPAGHFWELLHRARAMDNQVYIAGTGCAGCDSDAFDYWGKSLFVLPDGKILKQGGNEEEIVFAKIDFDALVEYRNNLRLMDKKRCDLYEIVAKKALT